MSIHFKFKSGREVHALNIDSIHISLGELKRQITAQCKLAENDELDLEVTDSNTNKVYSGDETLIDRNASLVVSRVPIVNAKRYNKNDPKNVEEHVSAFVEDKTSKIVNKKVSDTEEDRIREMVNQSTKDYDVSKYARGKGPVGPLRASYICFRCGQGGHYIKHCPTNHIDVKRSTGIPRSFMVTASADQKGAMVTADGGYAVPLVDQLGYQDIRKEKVPFIEEERQEFQKTEIPEKVKCPLCNCMLQDAVTIPCCAKSFCDECIRTLLLESEEHQCPLCNETGVSPDTLIPNRYLRLATLNYKNDSDVNGKLNGRHSSNGHAHQNGHSVNSPVIPSDNEESLHAFPKIDPVNSEVSVSTNAQVKQEILCDEEKNDQIKKEEHKDEDDHREENRRNDDKSDDEKPEGRKRRHSRDERNNPDDTSSERSEESSETNSKSANVANKYSLSVAPQNAYGRSRMPMPGRPFAGQDGSFMAGDMSSYYGPYGMMMGNFNFPGRPFDPTGGFGAVGRVPPQGFVNGFGGMHPGAFPTGSQGFGGIPFYPPPMNNRFNSNDDSVERFTRELEKNSRGTRGYKRSRTRSRSRSRGRTDRSRRSPPKDRYRSDRTRGRDRSRSRSARRDSRYVETSRTRDSRRSLSRDRRTEKYDREATSHKDRSTKGEKERRLDRSRSRSRHHHRSETTKETTPSASRYRSESRPPLKESQPHQHNSNRHKKDRERERSSIREESKEKGENVPNDSSMGEHGDRTADCTSVDRDVNRDVENERSKRSSQERDRSPSVDHNVEKEENHKESKKQRSREEKSDKRSNSDSRKDASGDRSQEEKSGSEDEAPPENLADSKLSEGELDTENVSKPSRISSPSPNRDDSFENLDKGESKNKSNSDHSKQAKESHHDESDKTSSKSGQRKRKNRSEKTEKAEIELRIHSDGDSDFESELNDKSPEKKKKDDSHKSSKSTKGDRKRHRERSKSPEELDSESRGRKISKEDKHSRSEHKSKKTSSRDKEKKDKDDKGEKERHRHREKDHPSHKSKDSSSKSKKDKKDKDRKEKDKDKDKEHRSEKRSSKKSPRTERSTRSDDRKEKVERSKTKDKSERHSDKSSSRRKK